MRLKEIKNTYAEDLTNINDNDLLALMCNEEGLKVVALSKGVYGINGGLFQGNKSGKLYKITKRNSNLFTLV